MQQLRNRAVLGLTFGLLGSIVLSSGAIAAEEKAVPADASEVCPAKPGTSLPPLTLRNLEGAPFNLNAAVAGKPAVLIFYRGGWCPYCNRQLSALREVEPELVKIGYQLIGVSPDLPAELKKSVAKEHLSYTLVSDSSMAAAKALGIAFRVDDATLEKYKGYGIDLEKSSGETHHLLPVPAVFVISTDGTIQFAYANPDYKKRLAPEVLLAAARAALPPAE